ncbi:meiosis induction protein kinase-like protein [Dothidotthia symphoricarpi CBS 119687]|uniref:Meiosis induction protein kinase-like protein n=1 Tax=Dothidotthia symphoricarpi CBS 119687 TaxID=1392245 RepID=A0A6A6AL23_9PLEO|nr:meiosis induction protein kinase-like protein [Dothidotthia symphoricarpi CBS 119687]KAF2131624.1 meiosis induction protein kinase-like protein [Dothidotthia symphoricarpi CBS 119687]
MLADSQTQPHGWASLEERYEVMKDIGDGSFGSVTLARVRTAGAHVARRGTLVAIKTMKKTFDSFSSCLELREVIFLRSLPPHPHLVPALDIFLDPYSRRLHIAMEYMDGNLYQLMKARDHKPMDGHSVKSILFQILSGLEHIHDREFFHRDIKPENILVSTSQQNDSSHPFRRYSAMMTPPSTPPVYTIKIADFGLARETHSKLPYTTYVSTRWYRAPEVLLRAGHYSAPVDIWAVGAMAVEIATLKPLFPGGNEVDQVWRVCEIMGSPGGWINKHGQPVGGGEWKDGVRLAQKLGFSFPKMAPHSIDTILPAPQWPASLAQFVTSCLLWDPRGRPTSTQALAHEYFQDAVDPLRLKSSSSRLLGRKQSDLSGKDSPDASPSITSKTSSWLRRSLVARESAPAVPQHSQTQTLTPRASPAHVSPDDASGSTKSRPNVTKRATWTNGVPSHGAPIPILPSIKPISPLSAEVTAQASVRAAGKIGRQLSQASHGNHYADVHRQEAERALNGQSGLTSPVGGPKEGFFSHLRKRARRLSGRYQTPMSPNSDDIEANAGCSPWASTGTRQPLSLDQSSIAPAPSTNSDYSDLDKVLQQVRSSVEGHSQQTKGQRVASNPMLKRHHSVPHGPDPRGSEGGVNAPISSRTRRAVQTKSNPSNRYETPNEEEELLSEVLASAHEAANTLDTQKNAPRHSQTESGPAASYLTPASSAKGNSTGFGQADSSTPSKPMDISKSHNKQDESTSKWPTPPYDENDWASSVAASLMATQKLYR